MQCAALDAAAAADAHMAFGCDARRYIDGTQLGVATGWPNLPCIFEYTGNPYLGEFRIC